MDGITSDLIEWAQRHQRVPTIRECHDIIGNRRPKQGNITRARRHIFHLRRIKPSEPMRHIPYPVPPEWSETT